MQEACNAVSAFWNTCCIWLGAEEMVVLGWDIFNE